MMMMMMMMMNRNRQPHPPGPVCELTPAPAAAGVGGVEGIFFVNKLSLSLHNFRNFPGHSTGKQRTDDTRHARSARTRKGALTSVVSKAPPFSKKKWENLARRKMPNLQNRIPHQRAERIFFSGLGQCTKAGAMEPPSHLCVRERTRLLVLFPRFDFSNKKIGGNVEKMPNLQNRIPHQRAGRIFFFWARPMHQDGRGSVTGKLLSAGRSSRQV